MKLAPAERGHRDPRGGNGVAKLVGDESHAAWTSHETAHDPPGRALRNVMVSDPSGS
jgi:hypothetical protein